MKTTIVALCLALACVSVAQAGRLERQLLQSSGGSNSVSVSGNAGCFVVNGKCKSEAYVHTQAINDAAKSIADALAVAVAEAEDDGDADAAAYAFAEAIAKAYALIISSHVHSVYVDGDGVACAYTYSDAEAYAETLSIAVAAAFAQSSNKNARAAGSCFAKAVAYASIQIFQEAEFGTCVQDNDYNHLYLKVITVGYVRTIARVFSVVYTAIEDNNAKAFAYCDAFASSYEIAYTILIDYYYGK